MAEPKVGRGRKKIATAVLMPEPAAAVAPALDLPTLPAATKAVKKAAPIVAPAAAVELPAPSPIAAPAAPVEEPAPADIAEAKMPEPALPVLPAPADEPVAEPAAAPAVATEPAPIAASESTVTPEPLPVPPEAGEPIQKGFPKMATSFNTASFGGERMQSMFGDMNERTKAAFEKSTKLAEDMTEFTKGNVEAIVASTRVAAKGAESLGQDMAETARKQFETATATFKSFAAAKSPTELFQLQSDYAKSYFDALVADTSKFSESMLKLAGDVAQPISSRFAVAAEKLKAPAL